jgi:hypothetical protein
MTEHPVKGSANPYFHWQGHRNYLARDDDTSYMVYYRSIK